MLRHQHLAVLYFGLLSATSAFQLPDGFLLPRQNPPLTTGNSGGTTIITDQGTPTAPTVTEPTVVTPPTSIPPTLSSPATEQTQPTLVAPTTTIPTTANQPGVVTPTTGTTLITRPTARTSRITTPITLTSDGTTFTSIPADTATTAPPSEATVTSTNLAPVPEVLTTITYTSDGRLVSSVATGTRTGVPTGTSKPGLADGDQGGTSTLSDVAKKVIGGIVGGIGGALLLAGIAFVVFRVWGRKKHQQVAQDEDGAEYFSASTDSIAAQKKSQQGDGWGKSSLTSKFAEPLERYKSPSVASPGSHSGWSGSGRVNAASNF